MPPLLRPHPRELVLTLSVDAKASPAELSEAQFRSTEISRKTKDRVRNKNWLLLKATTFSECLLFDVKRPTNTLKKKVWKEVWIWNIFWKLGRQNYSLLE